MVYPELYAQGIMISSSTMMVVGSILVVILCKVETSIKQINTGITMVLLSILAGLGAIIFALTWFATSGSYLYWALVFHVLQLAVIGITISWTIFRVLK